jgi:NTP pyrophosphatase (non-canonical NTP hydrolase)
MTSFFNTWIKERWGGGQEGGYGTWGTHPVPYSPTAAMGLPGETGEVMELLKKHARDGKHPGDKLLLELGDVIHYATVLAQSYGWSLDQVLQANIDKLVARDFDKAGEKARLK